jgi:hypothetical protein
MVTPSPDQLFAILQAPHTLTPSNPSPRLAHLSTLTLVPQRKRRHNPAKALQGGGSRSGSRDHGPPCDSQKLSLEKIDVDVLCGPGGPHR